MVETLAELPFIGDQVVCLSHDQARRPQRRSAISWAWIREGRLRYREDMLKGMEAAPRIDQDAL